jgi:ribonuclease HI
MPKATIITDGSADNSNGIGGWCAVVRTDNSLTELTGWATATTSNRMELMAAIEGMRSLTIPHSIELIADSSYLLKTLKNRWFEKWQLETHRSKPRPNMDLWEQLAGLIAFHDVTFVKVKGHSGDYWNTRADRLANYSRKEQIALVNRLDDFKDVRCVDLSMNGTQCKLHLGHSGICAFGNGDGVKPYGLKEEDGTTT